MVVGQDDQAEEKKKKKKGISGPLSWAYVEWILNFVAASRRFRPHSWVNNFGNYHRPSCVLYPRVNVSNYVWPGKAERQLLISRYIGRFEFRPKLDPTFQIYRRAKFTSSYFSKIPPFLDSCLFRCARIVFNAMLERSDFFDKREKQFPETNFSPSPFLFSFPPSSKLSTSSFSSKLWQYKTTQQSKLSYSHVKLPILE